MKAVPLDRIDKKELKEAHKQLLEHAINFDIILIQCDYDVQTAIEIMGILYQKEA